MIFRFSTLLLSSVLLAGCDSVFVEPAVWTEDDFSGEFGGAVAKAHYEANNGFYGISGTCLPAAKDTMLGLRSIGKTAKNGYILTILGLKPFRGRFTHAVLLVQGNEFGEDGFVFDNGYISQTPFPLEELVYHGDWEPLDKYWITHSIYEGRK